MNTTLISEKMEIKDNTFARQFETLVDGKLISVEYSFQEKKIFIFMNFIPLTASPSILPRRLGVQR